MNNRFKLLLILLALLVKPEPGFGQQPPASTLELLVATAQQAQVAHDYAAAEKAYKQAVRIEPSMPELWANLGLMQQETGNIASAIPSFQQANRLNPSLYVPDLFLGIDFVSTGKAQQAIPFLIKAEKINKTDLQTPLALGRAYYAVGKFSPAAQEFTRAIALDPKLGAAWFSLGIARLNQVEMDARKMTVESKGSPFAGALFAESLDKQGRFNEAATLYRSLMTAQPQPPCLHSELGFALLRHRDAEGAEKEFAAERASHPGCGLALVGQARMAIDNGESEEAVKLLQELWERDQGFFVSNAPNLMEGLSNDAASTFVAYFSQQTTGAITALLVSRTRLWPPRRLQLTDAPPKSITRTGSSGSARSGSVRSLLRGTPKHSDCLLPARSSPETTRAPSARQPHLKRCSRIPPKLFTGRFRPTNG